MDKSKVALGNTAESVGLCLAVDPNKLNRDDRIRLLEEQMKHMQRVIMKLRRKSKQVHQPAQTEAAPGVNKDGIPIGTICMGVTEKSLFLYYLTVAENGYVVGNTLFPSLSAAAEAVSQVRRSGWTFWKLLDGRTLKEVYKV